MLIDAGDNDDEKLIVDYLNNLKLKKLDYIVLTHSDADHCSGLDAVVKNLKIINVLFSCFARKWFNTRAFEGSY